VTEKIMQALDIDIRPVVAGLPMSKFREEQDGAGGVMLYDEWGCGWAKKGDSTHYIPAESPLKDATLEDLEKYDWPDPDNPERFVGISERARELYENSNYAVYGNVINNNIFLRATYLRGFTQFLMDLVSDEQFSHALLQQIVKIQARITSNFLDQCGKYIDIFRAGDDIATQENLIMSPDCYRKMIKPHQKAYFASIKERTDAKLLFHSCGAIYPALDDLIEIGVDVLNPIQVTCDLMSDTKKLKEEFGDRLSFCGGIDTQRLLPLGTPDDVMRETCRIISDMGHGGGYLLAAVHNFQEEVPPENILSMFAAVKKYGRYTT
jgi:uroporphyrinogen decarboxylase